MGKTLKLLMIYMCFLVYLMCICNLLEETFSLLRMAHYEGTPKYFLNEPLRNILSKSIGFFVNLLSLINCDQTIR